MNRPEKPVLHGIATALATLLVFAGQAISQELKVSENPEQAVLINDLAVRHPLSNYTDAETVLAAEINLSQLDLNAFDQTVKQMIGRNALFDETTRAKIGMLKQFGVEKVYVVANLAGLVRNAPVIVIPSATPKPISASLARTLRDKVQVADSGKAVLIGDLGAAPKQLRNDLISPLLDAKQLDHTIVVSMPAAGRQMLEKFWPETLPEDIPLNFSPRDLVRSVRRMVITFQTPPDIAIRVTIESDAESDVVASAIEQLKTVFADYVSEIRVNHDGRITTLEADRKLIEGIQKPLAEARDMARQMKLRTNLKMLGLAIHNYLDREKHLPPRWFVDPAGKPLHSWRVAILPYVEQVTLYRTIKLDRAWNQQDNEVFENTIPVCYLDESLERLHTCVRAPIFPGSLWEGEGPPKTLKDVTDKWHETIALIEAPPGNAIHWAKPEKWTISEDDPMADVFGDRDHAWVLLLDGSVLRLEKSEITPKKLAAMLTIAGGD